VIGSAIALLYFGALNALLSRYAGTCTQDAADHLGGLWVVLICYVLALTLLWRARPVRWTLVLIAPVVQIMLWHAAEGLRFAWGVFVDGQSACSLLVSAPFGMDGRETEFALLWLVAGLILPVMMLGRLWRNRSGG
jgi:hypothetical protein